MESWKGVIMSKVWSLSIRHLLTVVIVSGEMFDVGALVARAEDFATSLALTALTVLHLQPVAPEE